MTEDRTKSSGSSHSLPRPTARDVPFTRGVDSELEPAPRGKRPGQLPRDPTYEAELAQVELAVLRDPRPVEDPSTKPGRRVPRVSTPLPDSVTPESPSVAVSHRPTVPSPEPPPSPHGRAVASGTLLSVGAVDPRGKTERTLETPRMFISQQQGTEAYFKPGKIPAVTVHQAIETETVKLSDSIDPRRAKTIPRLRLDRAALQPLSELDADEDPDDFSEPHSSLDVSAPSPHWNQEEWDAADDEDFGSVGGEGQIHASLSPFREHAPPSFSLDGVETRPEPLAARRSELPPPAPSVPDISTVPTQRDLPAHRIEASRPPPAPATNSRPIGVVPSASLPAFERVSDAAAKPYVSDEVPLTRPPWLNYAAFVGALLFAVALGLWLTSGRDGRESIENAAASGIATDPEATKPVALPRLDRTTPAAVTPARESMTGDGVATDSLEESPSSPPVASAEPVRANPAPAKPATVASPPGLRPAASSATAPAIPSSLSKSSSPKPARETIF